MRNFSRECLFGFKKSNEYNAVIGFPDFQMFDSLLGTENSIGQNLGLRLQRDRVTTIDDFTVI